MMLSESMSARDASTSSQPQLNLLQTRIIQAECFLGRRTEVGTRSPSLMQTRIECSSSTYPALHTPVSNGWIAFVRAWHLLITSVLRAILHHVESPICGLACWGVGQLTEEIAAIAKSWRQRCSVDFFRRLLEMCPELQHAHVTGTAVQSV